MNGAFKREYMNWFSKSCSSFSTEIECVLRPHCSSACRRFVIVITYEIYFSNRYSTRYGEKGEWVYEWYGLSERKIDFFLFLFFLLPFLLYGRGVVTCYQNWYGFIVSVLCHFCVFFFVCCCCCQHQQYIHSTYRHQIRCIRNDPSNILVPFFLHY